MYAINRGDITKKFMIFLPLILGGFIGFILKDSYTFYESLEVPFFAPPTWLFPIVWSILYLLMGISHYLIKRDNVSDGHIDTIYYIQLFINLMWPIIFFVFEQLLLSSLWIVCLDIVVIIMIYRCLKINKLAGYLQMPYLVWSLFATVLNITIFIFNF